MIPKDRDPLWKLGAYLHQDWEDYYSDFSAAVRTLMEDEPAEVTSPMLSYIRELIGGAASDDELNSILKIRIDYAFELDGMSPRQFLEEVLRIGEESRK
jgi:hypothetical protein